MTSVTDRCKRLAARLVGAAGWASYAFVAWFAVTIGWQLAYRLARHYDWHVYQAAALDLVDRSLYRTPLYLEGLPIPVNTFNMPPLAAAWALPLSALRPEQAGVVWQLAEAVLLAIGVVVIATALKVRRPWVASGVVLGAYAWHVSFADGLIAGTNNFLVFALVSGFCAAYMGGRDRLAGLLLGLAIATKIWPVTLTAVVLRERRWSVLSTTAAVLVLQGVLFLGWLGPDVFPHMAGAIRQEVPPLEGVIGISELRRSLEWWPDWAGPAIAVVLLALPLRGPAGLGVAILAGLAVIANLWSHYLPAVILGLVLIAAGTVRSAGWPRWSAIIDRRPSAS